MPTTFTPLRYPGGKSKLSDFVIQLYKNNRLCDGDYVEPFAGGAGIAIRLLLNDYIWKAHLNDLDQSIYAFWHSVINESESLCNLIKHTPITVEEWHKQKRVQKDKRFSLLKLGFSTLFLNRTNRSGILSGGIIGGKHQNGNWKIDARFNKEGLIEKIQRIAQYKDRIKIYNMDASKFINKILPKLNTKSLINLDPPYYYKGKKLYKNYYQPEDHQKLARLVHKISQKWIVTYDDVEPIKKLYKRYKQKRYQISYSAQNCYNGSEVMIFGPKLKIPQYQECIQWV